MRQSIARGHGMARLAVAGAVLGACCLATGSVAQAATTVTLNYSCSVPLIGDQPMMASLVWDAAATHRVGQSTQTIPLTISAVISSETTDVLNVAGATSVQGSADVSGEVIAPQGMINGAITMNIGKTAVPNSGPLTVVANGILPSSVFTKPGAAQLVVGDSFTYSFTPETASGAEPLGVVNATCSLNPGQSGLIATFEILAAASTPSASPTSATGHANATGSAAANPTQTTSVQASSSANPPGSTRASTAPKTAASAASASSSAHDPRPLVAAENKHGGLGETQIIALAGGILAVLASGVLVWWLSRRRRKNNQELTQALVLPVVPAAAHSVQAHAGTDQIESVGLESGSASVSVGKDRTLMPHRPLPGLVRQGHHERRRRTAALSRQCRERDRYDGGLR